MKTFAPVYSLKSLWRPIFFGLPLLFLYACNNPLTEPSTAEPNFHPGINPGTEISGPTDKVPNATISTVRALPVTILADGSSSATITVTVKNATGEPLKDKVVSLSSDRGVIDTIIGPSPTKTSTSGVTKFTVTSATAGIAVITASIPSEPLSLHQTTRVNFTSAEPLIDLQAQSPDGYYIFPLRKLSVSWKDLVLSSNVNNGVLTNYTDVEKPSYASYVMADEPLAYWRLGENNTTGFLDQINDRTMVRSGTVTHSQAGALDSDTDKALTFAAGTNYLRCDSTGLPTALPYSIEAWVNFAGSAGSSFVFQGSYFNDVDLLSLSRDNTSGKLYVIKDNANVEGPVVANGSWNHVVVMFSESEPFVQFYVNGVDQTATVTQPATALVPHATPECTIGHYYRLGSTWGRQMEGSVDEVAIYDKLLTSEQIQAHYDARNSAWTGTGTSSNPLALLFNGSNTYVDLGTGANSSSEFSFETWLKLETPTGTDKVIFTNAESNNEGTSSETNKGISLKQGRDGKGHLELLIGPRSYTDEVLSDSPVGYWKLGEEAGTIAYDISGNGFHGNYIGSGYTQDIQDVDIGENDSAVKFNLNSATSITFPANATLNAVQTGNYTLTAWYKPTSVPANTTTNDIWHAIVSKNGNHMGLMYSYNQTFFMSHYIVGPTNAGVATTSTFPIGQWHHVAGVVNKTLGTVKIYVNGSLERTKSYTPNTAAQNYGTATFKVGIANPGAGTHNFAADGTVDEVAIFNYDLSDDRILAHYIAGKKRINCRSHAPLAKDSWHHVAGSFDSTNDLLRLMINGSEHCSLGMSGVTYTGSSNPLVLGKDTTGTNFWNGSIADFRTYDSSLSATTHLENLETMMPKFPASDVLPVRNGLKLWLKAEDIIGVAHNQALPVWEDSSGNKTDAYQVTSAKRPLFKNGNNGINGRPAVHFDKSSDHLFSIPLEMNAGDMSVFFVLKPSTLSLDFQYLLDAESGRFILAQENNAGTANKLGYHYLGTWRTVGNASQTAQLVEFIFSGNTGYVYRNGGSLGQYVFAPTAIGGKVTLGGSYQNDKTYNGLMSEVLIFEGALSTADRQAIEDYLNAKYKLW